MTLANCKKLLEHFNKIIDGKIERPVGHKNWGDVIENAKRRAADMEKRIAWKNSDAFKIKHGLMTPRSLAPKKEVKKDAKKST